MIGAIFDVDRTLVLGTSTERLFVLWQIRHGHLSLADLLRAVPVIGWQVVTLRKRGYVQYHAHLAGKRVEDVEDWAEQCFNERVKPRVSRDGMRAIVEHRASGHLTILLSGSIRPLVRRMSDFVGTDLFVSTDPEIVDGRYTGRLMGKHVGGREKAIQVARLAAEHDLELRGSYCYADHHTDAPMLELFGHPMPTNPDRGLERIARDRGWKVTRFE